MQSLFVLVEFCLFVTMRKSTSQGVLLLQACTRIWLVNDCYISIHGPSFSRDAVCISARSRHASHCQGHCTQANCNTNAFGLLWDASKVTITGVPGLTLVIPAARSVASLMNTSGWPGSLVLTTPKPLLPSNHFTRERSVTMEPGAKAGCAAA